MRMLCSVALLLAAVLPSLAQTAASAGPGLPKDPREVFAAAAPFYDFSDPALKPWHLKATYQLYNEKGDPTEKGTYEYWWASPQVYRSTWTRPSATHTDWHTAEGKHAYTASGEALSYFEERLETMLLSPLPPKGQLDPAKFRLNDQSLKAKGANIPCYMVVPIAQKGGDAQVPRRGDFPTYCFNAEMPVVVGIYSFGSLLTTFDGFAQSQGKVLPGEVAFRDGKRDTLKAKVDLVDGLSSTDAALKPPSDAVPVKSERVSSGAGVTIGKPIKQAELKFPPEGFGNGRVWMDAAIGTNGHIVDCRVITASSPALAAAAQEAYRQFVFTPSTLNGEPVEVEIQVEVNVQKD